MNRENEVEPLLKEFQFVQIAQWQAHKDVIKTVKYISQTDIPIIFTASMDRMAKIWTYNKDKIEPLGVLRQGYMLKKQYMWIFPLNNYALDLEKRQENVQVMLDTLRRKRDEDKSSKSKRDRSLSKGGFLPSIGGG